MEHIIENKKYFLTYILSTLIFAAIFFKLDNYTHPKFEIILITVLLIAGIICINYSFKNKKHLHRQVFLIILIFGIIMSVINPVLIICDENEHFARSDITSNGIIFPNYIENEGYEVSGLFIQLTSHTGETLANTNLFSENVNSTSNIFNGCFPQNPFYAYILSAIGVLVTKLCNLPVIWALYLGRLLNLVFYASVSALAIRKAPVYKMALVVTSCLPLAVYQAASFSADGFIIALSILAFGYLIYMFKSKVTYKELTVFFASVFLISLFKFPFALLGFLIFLIPKSSFDDKNLFILSRIIPIIILAVSMIYSFFYASGQLQHTLRQEHFIKDNVNVTGQVNNLLANPLNSFILFFQSIPFLNEMLSDLFRFSYQSWTYNSFLLSNLYCVFFTLFAFIYPHNIRLKKNSRLTVAVILFLIYIAVIFIQYLSWASVGYGMFDMNIGVYVRYFIPLIALIPLIISNDKINLDISNIDLKVVLTVIIFLSGVCVLTIAKFF